MTIESLKAELGIGNKIKRAIKLDFDEEKEIKQDLAECEVFLECLRRDPTKNLNLALGDVVYYGLSAFLKN